MSLAARSPSPPPPGGQFVTHIKALHGRPYDGHTLKDVIAELTQWTGVAPERIYVDKGYQGHDYRPKHRVFRVSGQPGSKNKKAPDSEPAGALHTYRE